MKIAERIVIVSLFLALFGGGYYLYYSVTKKQDELREAVAAGEYEIREEPVVVEAPEEDWRQYYPDTVAIFIGEVPVFASVADSLPERIQGLSGTPYLPDNVVKSFAFGVPGSHSIWMKDMQYDIDILWVDETGKIVHIEENVSPDTYPESFASPTPAWFVVETQAGFVAKHSIVRGDEVILPVPEGADL